MHENASELTATTSYPKRELSIQIDDSSVLFPGRRRRQTRSRAYVGRQDVHNVTDEGDYFPPRPSRAFLDTPPSHRRTGPDPLSFLRPGPLAFFFSRFLLLSLAARITGSITRAPSFVCVPLQLPRGSFDASASLAFGFRGGKMGNFHTRETETREPFRTVVREQLEAWSHPVIRREGKRPFLVLVLPPNGHGPRHPSRLAETADSSSFLRFHPASRRSNRHRRQQQD